MECPATPPDIADCALLRTPSPQKDERTENKTIKSGPASTLAENSDDTKSTNTDNKNDERCKSPDASCAICLGQIENMSYTDSCFHKFCFTCLLEWSKVRPVCPLCKARFKSIIHTIQSDNVYESYTLPPPATSNSDNAQASRQEMALFLEEIQRFRQNLSQQFRNGFASFQTDWRQHNRHDHNQPSIAQSTDSNASQVLPSLPPFRFPSRTTSAGPLWNRRRGVATSAFRRNIYRQNLYVNAESILDVTGRVRECNADWYRNNQAQTHRLVPWLNRELNALMEAQIHQVPYVLQLILDLIQRFNIQSPEFHEQMVPYTGTRTNHFQHEFYNYARSTYDMIGYDRHAMYSDAQPLTYVVSSDSTSSSSEDEIDVQVEPSPAINSNSSQTGNGNDTDMIVVDDSTSQLTAEKNYNTEENAPVASTSGGLATGKQASASPLIISSGESDVNQGGKDIDVEIVNYVKPRKDRTPVIVNIESSDDDIIRKEKQLNSEKNKPSGSFTSANARLSPPISTASPAIVVLGDSSPESNDIARAMNSSHYKEKQCNKPLWERNFETCFPNSGKASETIKKSKCGSSKPGRSKTIRPNKLRKRFSSPTASSDSDQDAVKMKKRANFQIISRKKKDLVKKRKPFYTSSSSLESFSSIEEDEGGWFQTGSEVKERDSSTTRQKVSSKGKGKGKGKSSESLDVRKKETIQENTLIVGSPSDSEDRPLRQKKRKTEKHKSKRRKEDLSLSSQSMKESSFIKGLLQNPTKVNTELCYDKGTHDMVDRKKSIGVRNESTTKHLKLKERGNEGCSNSSSAEEDFLFQKKKRNIFDSDSSSSISTNREKDYKDKTKVMSSKTKINGENEKSETQMVCKEIECQDQLIERRSSSEENSQSSNSYNKSCTLSKKVPKGTNVKSVVAKIDSTTNYNLPNQIQHEGDDRNRISEDLRVRLDKKKRRQKKRLKDKMKATNLEQCNSSYSRNRQLSISDYDDNKVINPSRIVVTSTLNNENVDNFHERTVSVHPPKYNQDT